MWDRLSYSTVCYTNIPKTGRELLVCHHTSHYRIHASTNLYTPTMAQQQGLTEHIGRGPRLPIPYTTCFHADEHESQSSPLGRVTFLHPQHPTWISAGAPSICSACAHRLHDTRKPTPSPPLSLLSSDSALHVRHSNEGRHKRQTPTRPLVYAAPCSRRTGLFAHKSSMKGASPHATSLALIARLKLHLLRLFRAGTVHLRRAA